MSNPDDEDELSIRDKFALSILNGMLSRSVVDKSHTNIITEFKDHYQSPNSRMKETVVKDMEKFVRVSYAIADIMRKVRLGPFE